MTKLLKLTLLILVFLLPISQVRADGGQYTPRHLEIESAKMVSEGGYFWMEFYNPQNYSVVIDISYSEFELHYIISPNDVLYTENYGGGGGAPVGEPLPKPNRWIIKPNTFLLYLFSAPWIDEREAGWRSYLNLFITYTESIMTKNEIGYDIIGLNNETYNQKYRIIIVDHTFFKYGLEDGAIGLTIEFCEDRSSSVWWGDQACDDLVKTLIDNYPVSSTGYPVINEDREYMKIFFGIGALSIFLFWYFVKRGKKKN